MGWFKRDTSEPTDALLRAAGETISRLERDFERSQKEHRRDLAVLNNVIDYLGHGLIVCDGEGEILIANAIANRMFGYEDLEGQSLHDLVPDEMKESHRDHVRNFISEEHGVSLDHRFGINGQFRGKRRDGEIFPISLTISVAPYNGHNLLVHCLREEGSDLEHYLSGA